MRLLFSASNDTSHAVYSTSSEERKNTSSCNKKLSKRRLPRQMNITDTSNCSKHLHRSACVNISTDAAIILLTETLH